MSENKRNVELLQRVKAHILAEPRRYMQQTFGLNKKTIPEYFKSLGDDSPPCGTVACLAGWVVDLEYGDLFDEEGHQGRVIYGRARDAIGFSEEEAATVFSDGERWPEPFRSDLKAASTKAEQAEVAARFIDYLCEGGSV